MGIERRSPNRVVLRGMNIFIDGSSPRFPEYVLEEDNRVSRVSYRFNYTKQDISLVFLDMIMRHTIQSSQHFHSINTYLETGLLPRARRAQLMY